MGASLPFCAHIGAMHALFHSEKEFQRCAQVGTMLAIFHSVCVCERERDRKRWGGVGRETKSSTRSEGEDLANSLRQQPMTLLSQELVDLYSLPI